MMIQFIFVLLSLGIAVNLSGADPMKAFPPASPGHVRHVLTLPERDNESLLQVELIVGKILEIDSRNVHFLGGGIDAVNIEGWGYTRYVVSKLEPLASTLIAVDPDEPKVKKFVPLGGEPYLVRYNSRLPLVVYAPEGSEVRFRIWEAGAEEVIPRG